VSARLVVDGEVTAPRSLEFQTLRALSEQLVAAVRLETLLVVAGVTDEARSVVFESSEGSFLVAMSLEAARDCVIVYRVGEAPLPRGLGGPFRLVTQGRLHCGDVKALGTIYVSKRAHIDDSDTERVCVRMPRAV
jgi:DMSO/TMAO reductase YedYZ molybdopterin-dependent catalytic subunit